MKKIKLIYLIILNRQVAIFVDDEFFCGGTLISNQWVLTAARKSLILSNLGALC